MNETDLPASDAARPPVFEDIYAQHADRILNLAFRLTGNDEVARDLCQEVFVKVYQNLESFEQRSGVFTWTYRIALNHITNYLKKERRRHWIHLADRNVSDVAGEDEVESGFWGRTTTPSADRGLERRQRDHIVWREIQTLPEKYRVPLVLHHYESLAYKEIAEMMQLSMSAVESRIHRAKKQLIKKLEPWLDKI